MTRIERLLLMGLPVLSAARGLGAEANAIFVLDHNPSISFIVAARSASPRNPRCVREQGELEPPQGADTCGTEPPFEPVYSPRARSRLTPIYGWADAAQAAGGLALVEQWRTLANARVPAHCDAEICDVILRANSPTSEERLIRCRSLVYNGRSVGAPWDCELIAAAANGAVYVRVIRGYEGSENRTLGLPDFDILVLTRTVLSTEHLLEYVRSELSHEPLELTTRRTSSALLTGVSEFKPSRVLERYRPRPRELATVRVDAAAVAQPELSGVKLLIATNLLVNPLATTNPEDWRRPSEAQEREYVRAVMNAVRRGLSQACPSPVWRSDAVMTCGLTPETELPRWARP